jgi:hypothetical protein
MTEWIVETLSRKPLRVADDTAVDDITIEFEERLEALLAANHLDATADGWRKLALLLAMLHEPAFAIETPADRSTLGGRPAAMGNFIARSLMKQEIRAIEAETGVKRGAQAKAAKVVADKLGISEGTANNSVSRAPVQTDAQRRAPYQHKAEAALAIAAERLSQK